MKRLIPIIFVLVAATATAQTPDERRCELAALHGLDWAECVAAPPPPPLCPNGVIDPGETCDGGQLAGQTCASLGFDSGTLACAADCASFDTSNCSTAPPPPPPVGVYGLLAQNLPALGGWAVIPGSENVRGDVLVEPDEFAWCNDVKCSSAHNSFLAWVGMAFNETTGEWWNPAGGGHADYGGNETYVFDFPTLDWTRMTDPTPYDGPILTSNSGPTCQLQSQLPYSAHTYDGAQYVPSTNEIVLMMTVNHCIFGGSGIGPVDGGFAVWDLDTDTWREVWAPAFGAPSGERSGYARTAYDEARDVVYFAARSSWKELDPQNNYAMTQIGTIQNGLKPDGTGVAEFDQVNRYLYWTSHNFGVFRVPIALDGTWGAKEELPVSAEFIALDNPLAIAIHKPTGHLVIWGSLGRVFRIDPEAGTLEDLTVSGGSATSNKRIYSKWVYVSAVDAFVGINDPREGVWVYRLPDSPPSLPADPPIDPAPIDLEPLPSAANFDERCAATGVVLCDPLDTEGPWGYDVDGVRRLMNNSDSTTGIPTTTWWRDWRGVQNSKAGTVPGHVVPRLDTTMKASGSGSIKMDFPGFSRSGGAGLFTTNFSDDLSRQFGEGETFYVQYRWRADCDFIYLDCDPASPTYRTARRGFASIGGGNPTYAKLSIIGTGDTVLGGRSSMGACTNLEIVTNHSHDHLLYAYHSCGWYAGFSERVRGNGAGWDFQPNGTALGADDDASPTCWSNPDPVGQPNVRKTWGYTGPDCFYLEVDEWMTIQLMVQIGTWQPLRDTPENSHVTIWGAREGEPQTVIIDHDLYLRGPRREGGKYGKVWLLPFMTNKDPAIDHPTAHVWYDELIVSTEFIADPS